MSSLSNAGHLNFLSGIEIEISYAGRKGTEDNKVTSHSEIESDFNFRLRARSFLLELLLHAYSNLCTVIYPCVQGHFS